MNCRQSYSFLSFFSFWARKFERLTPPVADSPQAPEPLPGRAAEETH